MEQEKNASQGIIITTRDGKPMKVPPEGALGLLALGYRGLIAWRQARKEYYQFLKQQKTVSEGEKPVIKTDIEEKI